MSRVYVLLLDMDYEGDDIVDVYCNLESVKSAVPDARWEQSGKAYAPDEFHDAQSATSYKYHKIRAFDVKP